MNNLARHAIYRSSFSNYDRGPYSRGLQRVADFIVALSVIIILSPLLALIWAAVRGSDGGGAIFRHRRIGHAGQPFFCLKFRTMVVDSDERLSRLLRESPLARAEWDVGQKLTKDPRVTAIGKFLRYSSLDELPQLFNVLKGEMSLVGPRPIIWAEAHKYGRYFAYYCAVRPGITGLWQVSGRNSTTYRRRIAADVLYVRRRNIWMKARIMFATIPAVLMARGAM